MTTFPTITYGEWQARERDLRARLEAVEAAFTEYADHQSWRCAYQDRYPWEPDCPCGLTKVERELALSDPARGDEDDPTLPGW